MSNKYKKYKEIDHIPYRIKNIKKILDGKKLPSMIDFKSGAIDDDLKPHTHDKLMPCNDIRCILKKKNYDFKKVIHKIGGSLLYIKSGTTGHTFRGFDTSNERNGLNYAVKVVAYPRKENYGDYNDVRRPENAEQLMLKLLSQFVITGQSPHIVLPMITFSTAITHFTDISKKRNFMENKKYIEFIKRYKNGDYYDTVSVLISEWAKDGDLLDYFRKNWEDIPLLEWKVVLFQLLSVLAVIQNKYPGFRHNDLKANNVLKHNISSMQDRNNKFRYIINGQTYVVPNIYYQIKIWDFDFACIPNLIENSKVNDKWTNKINVKPEKNRYYDVHYFFNTLIRKGFLPELLTSEKVPKEVQDFINRVIPDKYKSGKYIHKRGRLLRSTEYTTPDKLLKTDPFFQSLRCGPEDLTESDDNSLPRKSATSKSKSKGHKLLKLSD